MEGLLLVTGLLFGSLVVVYVIGVILKGDWDV